MLPLKSAYICSPACLQVRFEVGYYSLKPDIKVIAPWREWDLNSRTKLIAYAGGQAHLFLDAGSATMQCNSCIITIRARV
jgi:hypothetical protein